MFSRFGIQEQIGLADLTSGRATERFWRWRAKTPPPTQQWCQDEQHEFRVKIRCRVPLYEWIYSDQVVCWTCHRRIRLGVSEYYSLRWYVDQKRVSLFVQPSPILNLAAGVISHIRKQLSSWMHLAAVDYRLESPKTRQSWLVARLVARYGAVSWLSRWVFVRCPRQSVFIHTCISFFTFRMFFP